MFVPAQRVSQFLRSTSTLNRPCVTFWPSMEPNRYGLRLYEYKFHKNATHDQIVCQILGKYGRNIQQVNIGLWRSSSITRKGFLVEQDNLELLSDYGKWASFRSTGHLTKWEKCDKNEDLINILGGKQLVIN